MDFAAASGPFWTTQVSFSTNIDTPDRMGPLLWHSDKGLVLLLHSWYLSRVITRRVAYAASSIRPHAQMAGDGIPKEGGEIEQYTATVPLLLESVDPAVASWASLYSAEAARTTIMSEASNPPSCRQPLEVACNLETERDDGSLLFGH